jgi:hypothetical protein
LFLLTNLFNFGNLSEKYWTNPQYLVRLNFIDEGDNENLCTMIIALMQKDTRQRRLQGLEGEDYVQFRVFKVRIYDSFIVDDTSDQSSCSARISSRW